MNYDFSDLYKPIGGICYPARTFINLELPEVPFYIDGWLPRPGRLEIYAPAKTGKTFLALQLARCLGSGEDFLGIKTHKARVLYLQFELGLAALQQRMISTGKDYENVWVGTTFSMSLDTDEGRKELLDAMEAVEPEVLILDPLYKIMNGDENSVQDVKVITNFLDAVMANYNCAVVFIHHSGKDSSKGGRGSSLLEGWPDSVVEAKHGPVRGIDQTLQLRPKFLRHAVLPPEPITAIMRDGEFYLAESVTKEERVRNMILGQDDPFTANDIAIKVGCTVRTVSSIINTLVDEGLITKTGRGIYARSEENVPNCD
ncbi:MAG: AAA family ATPase [Dehalogenimonas sp.]